MIELAVIKECANPNKNLVCFHYAGSGANYFREWGKYIGASTNLYALRLPGRETLYHVPPYKEFKQILSDIKQPLLSLLSQSIPLNFFGHSMGALIAFETARVLRNYSNLNGLYLSGLGHPKYISHSERKPMTKSELKDYFDINNLELDNHADELLEIANYVLLNDYAVCDSYQYLEMDKLNLPITAFVGRQDKIHTYASAQQWKNETRNQFSIHSYSGGHLFINQHILDVISKIQGE